MKFTNAIIYIIILLFLPNFLVAQNNSVSHKVNIEIPEVALLGLVSNSKTILNINSNSPVEAGNTIRFTDIEHNNDIWLNYSSIIKNASHSRRVVALIQGEIPQGLHLMVEASEAQGAGKGKLGHSTGMIMLSNQPTEIISDIGSCFTGTGVYNGHSLTYTLKMDNENNTYGNINEGQTALQVVFTLTDYN